MVTVKKSAGIAPEVNMRNLCIFPIQTRILLIISWPSQPLHQRANCEWEKQKAFSQA